MSIDCLQLLTSQKLAFFLACPVWLEHLLQTGSVVLIHSHTNTESNVLLYFYHFFPQNKKKKLVDPTMLIQLTVKSKQCSKRLPELAQ